MKKFTAIENLKETYGYEFNFLETFKGTDLYIGKDGFVVAATDSDSLGNDYLALFNIDRCEKYFMKKGILEHIHKIKNILNGEELKYNWYENTNGELNQPVYILAGFNSEEEFIKDGCRLSSMKKHYLNKTLDYINSKYHTMVIEYFDAH